MITTTSILPSPVQQSFDMRLLSVKTPNFIYNIPAMMVRMPRNGGNTLRQRRYNPLPVQLAPLGNSGIMPAPSELTAIDIDSKMAFYGAYLLINEQVTLQAQDPVLNQACARLGVQLRQTEDQLTSSMLASTAGFINCTGGLNGDIPSNLTRSDIDEVVRVLLGADAYTMLDMMEGEDKFGTAPTRDAYWAMAHTDLSRDLDGVNGFVYKSQYPSPMNAPRSEWGATGNLRFMLTSIGSKTLTASALGSTVYNIFCTGMQAYANILQDGYSASFIYRPPVYDSALALNSSVGWKTAFVPRILNDEWIVNLRCTLDA